MQTHITFRKLIVCPKEGEMSDGIINFFNRMAGIDYGNGTIKRRYGLLVDLYFVSFYFTWQKKYRKKPDEINFDDPRGY